MKRNLEDPEIDPIVKKRKVDVQTFQQKSLDKNYSQNECDQEIARTDELPKDISLGQITSEYLLKEHAFVQPTADVADQSSLYNQVKPPLNNYVQQPDNMYTQPQPLQYNQMPPIANNYVQILQNAHAQPSQQYNQMQSTAVSYAHIVQNAYPQPGQYIQMPLIGNNYDQTVQNVYVQRGHYNQIPHTVYNFNQRLESFILNAKFEQKIYNYIHKTHYNINRVNIFIENLLSIDDIELKLFAINAYLKLVCQDMDLLEACNAVRNHSGLQNAIVNCHGPFVKLILDHCDVDMSRLNDTGDSLLQSAIHNEYTLDILEKIVRKSPDIIKLIDSNGWTALNLIANNYEEDDIRDIIFGLFKYIDTEDIVKAIKIEKSKDLTGLLRNSIRDTIIDTLENIFHNNLELSRPEFLQQCVKDFTLKELKCIKLSQIFDREDFKCDRWNMGYEEACADAILDFTDNYAKELLAKNFFKIIGVSNSLGDSPIKVIASEHDIMSVILQYLAPYGFWPELHDRVIENDALEVIITGEESTLI